MIEQTKIRDELVQLIGELPENEIISVKRFVEFIISQTKASFQSGRQKEKEILIKEFKGCCSHLPGGSEEFIREKHEDGISDHRRKALMFRGGAEEFMRGKLEKLEEVGHGLERIELMKKKGNSEQIAMKESHLESENLKNKYKEREILIKELKGCCSHLPGGSEEFMREKHEEIELEEKQWEERLH